MLKFNSVKKKFGKNGQVALNLTLQFPSRGLVAVVGKSGCGKSTLINLASLLDTPTSGEVLYRGKNINKFSKKKKEQYRNQEIGIIFQHYNLLEEHNALFNIALPYEIKGHSHQKSLQKATILLKKFNIDPAIYKTKVKHLSGGEKERIAILRSIINEPKIVLADEPTGALDIKNSELVMEHLKEISKTRLVILVSHNAQLVEKYADRIITLCDGQVQNDVTINEIEETYQNDAKPKSGINSDWTGKIAINNFIKRFARNILSISSLFIGIISTLLILGFYQGAPISIENESKKQFDYGVCTFSKQISSQIEGSKISLVQMLRPTNSELLGVNLKDYTVTNNYDYLLNSYPKITLGEEVLTDLSFRPIYSFKSAYCDSSLLIDGNIPPTDTLFEVVINDKAKELIEEKTGTNAIGTVLEITSEAQSNYYGENELEPVVIDYFVYKKQVRIAGVIEELSFLNTPKIYYSYVSFENYLKENFMINLSQYFNSDYTWFDRIEDAGSNEEISSYSVRCFLRNINKKEVIKRDVEKYSGLYVLESLPYVVESTLNQLIEVASTGMGIFLAISIIGTCLILGIVSFSSYVEDRKKIAVLSSLGANKDSIYEIYIAENFIVGFIAILISLLLSNPISKLGNFLIQKFLGFENIINIPFESFMGRNYFLPILLVISVLFICVFSTMLPIAFASKISLREELKDEW